MAIVLIIVSATLSYLAIVLPNMATYLVRLFISEWGVHGGSNQMTLFTIAIQCGVVVVYDWSEMR